MTDKELYQRAALDVLSITLTARAKNYLNNSEQVEDMKEAVDCVPDYACSMASTLVLRLRSRIKFNEDGSLL